MQPVYLDDPDYRKLDAWYTQIGIVSDAFTEIMLSIQSPDDYSRYDACFSILEYRFAELINSFPAVPVCFDAPLTDN